MLDLYLRKSIHQHPLILYLIPLSDGAMQLMQCQCQCRASGNDGMVLLMRCLMEQQSSSSFCRGRRKASSYDISHPTSTLGT